MDRFQLSFHKAIAINTVALMMKDFEIFSSSPAKSRFLELVHTAVPLDRK